MSKGKQLVEQVLNLFPLGVNDGGFAIMEYEHEDPSDDHEVVKRNFLTNLGKMLYHYLGPNRALMHPSGIAKGAIYRGGGPIQTFGSGSNAGGIQDLANSLTVYLLEVTQEFTPNDTVIPIYDQTLQWARVIGYASLSRSPKDTKEGVITDIYPEFFTNDFASVQRWSFAETQANGRITHVAMGLNIFENPSVSMRFAKGISHIDSATFGGVDNATPYFIPPGVTGVTSADEILFSHAYNYNNVASAKIQMSGENKGVTTLLETTDPLYNMPLGYAGAPTIVANGVFYFSRQGYIHRLDPATKQAVSIGSCNGSMFLVGNTIYYHSGGSETTFYAYDTVSKSSAPSKSFVFNNTFTNLFVNTSASSMFRGCIIRRLPDGKYLVSTSTSPSSYGPKHNIIIEDILAMESTQMYIAPPNLFPHCSEYTMGNEQIIFASGEHFRADNYITVQGNQINDPLHYMGLVYSKPTWMGNMITLLKLDSPETKTDLQNLKLSYGFISVDPPPQ